MKGFPVCVMTLLMLVCSGAFAQTTDSTANKPKADPPDDPSKWFSLVLGAQAGGGLDSMRHPTAQAGVKIGSGPLVLDLSYDRVHGHNGFSTELSGMLPVFRFPLTPKTESTRYVRFYAEPGVGYRAGGAPFGGYASAKVMAALISDKRIYQGYSLPYIEYQHRFPFNSPLRGDDRIAVGVMVTVCGHCGFD